jgi:hypothetical protein
MKTTGQRKLITVTRITIRTHTLPCRRTDRRTDSLCFRSGGKADIALARDSHATAASVHYLPQEGTVVLAEEQVHAWGQNSQVGVYTTVDIPPLGLLELKKTLRASIRAMKTHGHLSESSGKNSAERHNMGNLPQSSPLQPDRRATRQPHPPHCLHSHPRSGLQRV